MTQKEPKSSEKILASALEKSGRRNLDPGAGRKLLAFIEELSGWGRRVHLVGKGSLGTNLEAQILDSILLLDAAIARLSKAGEPAATAAGAFSAGSGRIADIGSGAGFPGIVWSILLPGASLTLFERRAKQQAFLDRTIALLGISGARIAGEDAGRYAGAGEFDVVTSKAAGRLAEMAPIAGKLLREGGSYVTIKGGFWRGELDAIAGTGLGLLDEIDLPHGRGHAVILRRS